MSEFDLINWGLSERFIQEATIYKGLTLARVTEQHRNLYKVICEGGFLEASVSGKFTYNVEDNSEFPVVGDWVMIEKQVDMAVIHNVLQRKSAFVRKSAGTSRGIQIVASNIDMLFICMALNEDYNLRRMERYLSIAWSSGAAALVVLTKADLCEDITTRIREISDIAMGTDVLVCSSLAKDGYDSIPQYITPGKTIAFIGSSGVGKSTLINHLIGKDVFATKEISADGSGKHTTTHRQLISLPNGAAVIDTPGMRELGTASADTERLFSDITNLSELCKFHDCSHTTEPGCAIRNAIQDGTLDESRFENYKKIQSEINYDTLSSKQIENEKINRMFGGKNEMKNFMREIKNKNQR